MPTSILMAVADANYRFTYVSVGEPGSVGDAATFARSSLAAELHAGRHLHRAGGFPHSKPPRSRFRPYLLGDAAFKAESFLLKLFTGSYNSNDPRRLFNLTHCRMRRCVENAFGHLKGAFRVLCKPCTQDPVFLMKVVRVCVALHNVRKLPDDPFQDSDFTQEERLAQIPSAGDNPDTSFSPSCVVVRNYLMDYLVKNR